MERKSAIIELNNVTFSAQTQVIVEGFSFSFEEGKSTALVGPSGGGKSTVLKLAAGILVPDAGRVSYRGRDVHAMSRAENLAFRKEAAMVFQDSALWANQSLHQILDLPLRIHFPRMPKPERDKRIREVLGEVGYRRGLSIRPAALSMGEQKLIAFARAALCRPELLFLDEWTESLDKSSAARLIRLVEQHRSEHNTVIFVSHDFGIIRKLADYIVMVVDGKFYLGVTKDEMEHDEVLAASVERGITG